MSAPHLDRKIGSLAARQHGAFTHQQALSVGFTRAQIRTRITKGRWLVVSRGTYAIAGSADTFERRVWLALLRFAPGAAISHLAAAYLLRIIDQPPSQIDVTVPHGAHHPTRIGVRTHRAKNLAGRDVRTVSGIRVTCPARTLCDLAGILGRERFEAVLDTALELGLVSIESVRRYIDEKLLRTCRGSARLRGLLDDRSRGVPGSELERVFLRVLRRGRLPEPRRQFKVGNRRIDFAYAEQRIAIELDGLGPHSSKKTFIDDRRRQNTLVLEGWVVLRFTWDDLIQRPGDVIAAIEAVLQQRSAATANAATAPTR